MKKEIKALLIRPKYSSIVANLEPYGLEYLVGLANELNIKCEIHDEFQYPWTFRFARMRRLIEKGGYNFIGFNANANTVDYIIKRASQLKKLYPDITIMVGGPEAELNYREFFTDDIDIVYYDNGLASLKNMWESGLDMDVLDKQTGISFKRDGEWVVKEKGSPVNGFIVKPDRTAFYKGLKKNFIFMKGKYALMKASFSCPFNCAFCYCTKMNSGCYTERDIYEVLDEVEEIRHDKIWFVDDTFFYDKERVITFCNEVIKRGIKKTFMAYARADFLQSTSHTTRKEMQLRIEFVIKVEDVVHLLLGDAQDMSTDNGVNIQKSETMFGLGDTVARYFTCNNSAENTRHKSWFLSVTIITMENHSHYLSIFVSSNVILPAGTLTSTTSPTL